MTDKRFWTTPVQREWLKQQLPAYILARQDHRLPIYWPTLYALWFAEWPARKPIEDNLTDSGRDDDDADLDVVENDPLDMETSTLEPTAILGKRKAGPNEGCKKKRVS